MNIRVAANYEEMSRIAAEMFADVIRANKTCVLGLATGDTPIGMYDLLVKEHKENGLDFSGVSSVNLDEYYPIAPTDAQSYRYFMNTHLFDRVNIDKKNTYVPNGSAADASLACEEHERTIDDLGGIDIQVLGIGRNGHIGFNEPAVALEQYTHLTALTEDTINANARFFESDELVPRSAITMGICSIFKARQIIILASGESKAEAVKKMLCGGITTDCPASLLCLHPSVTLVCDEAAYSLM